MLIENIFLTHYVHNKLNHFFHRAVPVRVYARRCLYFKGKRRLDPSKREVVLVTMKKTVNSLLQLYMVGQLTMYSLGEDVT